MQSTNTSTATSSNALNVGAKTSGLNILGQREAPVFPFGNYAQTTGAAGMDMQTLALLGIAAALLIVLVVKKRGR